MGGRSMRGYINKQYTVWCGCCPVWDQLSAINKAIATKEFKKAGWKYTKEKGWLCKVCK
jgi:hypothetical protein